MQIKFKVIPRSEKIFWYRILDLTDEQNVKWKTTVTVQIRIFDIKNLVLKCFYIICMPKLTSLTSIIFFTTTACRLLILILSFDILKFICEKYYQYPILKNIFNFDQKITFYNIMTKFYKKLTLLMITALLILYVL